MKIRKHSVIPVLIIVFTLFSSCSQKTETDWSVYELKGKVKKYVERNYEPETKFGEWYAGEQYEYGNHSVAFDSNGNYTKIDFINEKNELRKRTIPKRENGKVIEEFKYDEDGQLEKVAKCKYLSDSKVEYILYDEDGKEVGSGKTFLENGRISRRDYKEFSDGKTIFEIRMKFKHNEDGLVSALEQTDEDGNVENYRYEYLEFDDQNNWTKRLNYNVDDSKMPERLVIRNYDYYEN
ncbi:hypothetical protein [uncultured Kordia sp.]|uniref:hypothetical protein n=1 Tax=uncultured Kordia sp. TaxID=507699 RepID=UPI00261F76E8|nr:hypothetical protein [uncultured Kordia sp.]